MHQNSHFVPGVFYDTTPKTSWFIELFNFALAEKLKARMTFETIFYFDWYFSTIFVDNLVTSIAHQPYIS